MQQSEIYSKLTKIFRDIFDQDVVLTQETAAPDVDGWDSFAHINLMLAIELEFDVKFTTSDLEQMHTVGDLATFIERHATSK
jgi:acyl carrier protein